MTTIKPSKNKGDNPMHLYFYFEKKLCSTYPSYFKYNRHEND